MAAASRVDHAAGLSYPTMTAVHWSPRLGLGCRPMLYIPLMLRSYLRDVNIPTDHFWIDLSLCASLDVDDVKSMSVLRSDLTPIANSHALVPMPFSVPSASLCH